MDFAPTDEQTAAINAALEMVKEGGTEAIKVNAFAGTGKTSTLVLIAEAMPDVSFLYVAFNRAIKDEAVQKFPDNVKCVTGHGLAYAKTIGHFGKRFQKSWTPLMRRVENSEMITPIVKMLGPGSERRATLTIRSTLTKFCQSDDKRVTREHMPTALFLSQETQEERDKLANIVRACVQNIWDRLIRKDSDIPVTHDIYLKFFALQEPELNFDVILFDEAQDANPVLLGLIERQRAYKILVGDKWQQIYAWRGAINAMQNAQGKELALTRSFRFGDAIASEANIVLSMLGETKDLKGFGDNSKVVDSGELPNPNAILCRSNAGVLNETLHALDKGLRVAVVGGTYETVKLLEAAYDLYRGDNTSDPELGIFGSWGEFVEFSETDEGTSYRPIIRTVEKYGDGILSLCDRLKNSVVSEDYADIVISTAHKAKGREWNGVVLADDFQSFVNIDENTKEVSIIGEEANLFYVALTRAQITLDMNGHAYRIRHDAHLLGKDVEDLPVMQEDIQEEEIEEIEKDNDNPLMDRLYNVMSEIEQLSSFFQHAKEKSLLAATDRAASELEFVLKNLEGRINN